MKSKHELRLKRARKTRAKIKDLRAYRLSVHRTPKHIYAQVIDASGGNVVAAASSLQKSVMADGGYTGNADAAALVGKAIAQKAKEAGISDVAFDRSGFKYHGRVKALADAAREGGLKF